MEWGMLAACPGKEDEAARGGGREIQGKVVGQSREHCQQYQQSLGKAADVAVGGGAVRNILQKGALQIDQLGRIEGWAGQLFAVGAIEGPVPALANNF